MENWISHLQQKTLETNNVKESEILVALPYKLLESWDNFMRGKTCPILDDGDHGVYPWDLKQFLNSL
jgi:hypothetical protein